MLKCKRALFCLLLILCATVTTGRSAVLPTESTTTPTSPSDSHHQYKNERKPCDCHCDCNCSVGIGVCFLGSCVCLLGMSNPRTMTEAEIADFMSHHSGSTSGPKTTVDGNVL